MRKIIIPFAGLYKYAIGFLLIASLIITQTSCSRSIQPISSDNYFLDTTCTLTIYDMDGSLDEDETQKVFDKAWDTCRRLDKTLSRTVDASDVSKINNADGQWVEVSDDTLAVIKAGLRYAELSDGGFDITVGTVTDLWDYHSDNPVVPSQETINEALSHVDYHNVQIDGHRVRLLDPDTRIDLGGIAKGYVADRVADVMMDSGVTSGIVNLGGNVVTIGTKPSEDGFKVGIEKPYSDRTENIGSVISSNQTIVTSGVYERQFEVDGRIYHHILSTTTGYPVTTDLDAVSLVAGIGHSMDADALSTICLIKGSKEGKKFIESQGIEAIFCLSDGSYITTEGLDFTPSK